MKFSLWSANQSFGGKGVDHNFIKELFVVHILELGIKIACFLTYYHPGASVSVILHLGGILMRGGYLFGDAVVESHHLQYKSICKSISLVSFFCGHKYDRGAFYSAVSKAFTNFVFEQIDRFFLHIVVNEDDVHSNWLSEFISPKVVGNLILIFGKEGSQFLFETLKKKLLKDRKDLRFYTDRSSSAFFLYENNSRFIKGIDLFFDRRESPSEFGF